MYLLTDEIALVQSTDFFTPIVDEPYEFGAIAAANALSDIYAMGATPITALSIAGVPLSEIGHDRMQRIMLGGADKIQEAGAELLGGHSVQDTELKFGYAVTGITHPDRILTKCRARPGDRLVLTKPIGTGIISTAIKKNKATESQIKQITQSMLTLNKVPAEVMAKYDVHACTDVTGFSLLGHAVEMLRDTELCFEFDVAAIPLFEGTLELAKAGCCPGAIKRNRKFVENHVGRGTTDDVMLTVLCDPQTSGGLLIALPDTQVGDYLRDVIKKNVNTATEVGCVKRRAQDRNLLILKS